MRILCVSILLEVHTRGLRYHRLFALLVFNIAIRFDEAMHCSPHKLHALQLHQHIWRKCLTDAMTVLLVKSEVNREMHCTEFYLILI